MRTFKYSIQIIILALITFIYFNPAVICAQAKADSLQVLCKTDGPYIFYKGDMVYSKRIIEENGKLVVKIDSAKNKSGIKVNCYSSETGDHFSFPLKKNFIKDKAVYPAQSKIFVISDIHGNFKGFKTILLGAGVIKKSLRWNFGKGHVVFIGDIFDRGIDPTECLWLIYKLEDEAVKAGGNVHFLLGNHEIMNMNNNVKYVNKKILSNMKMMNEQYKMVYNSDTEIGRWLRTKNIIEKIGNITFVHGGYSPKLMNSKLSFDQMNRIALESIGKTKDQITSPEEKIVTSSTEGPYWYRDEANSVTRESAVDSILASIKSKKIIIGHTIVPNILSLYNGKIIAVNVDHQANMDKGVMFGLIIINNKLYVVDQNGKKTLLK